MAHFADCAGYRAAEILKNELVARDTRVLRFRSEGFASNVQPGQFFMLRLDHSNDPLIGRAFALWDQNTTEHWIEVVYLVKGKFTSRLAELKIGDRVVVWGPLGNSFSNDPVDRLIMVAGGIGQTPFLALAKQSLAGFAKKVDLCYGARTAAYLANVQDFQGVGVHVHIATEDGSQGIQGRVTVPLLQILEQTTTESRRVVCCGPEPMMEAVARICLDQNVRCQVSLETPMACGIGICFSCVAKVGSSHDWDYKRTCVEGPIFEAANIVW